MQKYLKILLLFTVLNFRILSAEKYRGEVFLLLRDPISTSLGNLGVSYPLSPGTSFLNPSLTPFLPSHLYLTHYEMYNGFISLENIYLKLPYFENISILFSHLHSQPIEVTELIDNSLGISEGNVEIIGKHQFKFSLFNLSFGREVNENSLFGLNIKIFRESFSDYFENGTGVDIGYQYHYDKTLNIGIVLRDALFTLLKGNSIESISPSISFGLTKETQKLLLSLEADIFTDGPYPGAIINVGKVTMDIKAGAQYKPKENLSIRLGFYRGYINAGAGIQFGKFQLDYSITPNPELYITHKVGIGRCF